MIVIKLRGGLGNQLFGWAFGRALECRGHKVAYHTGMLNQDQGRRLLLRDLGLKIDITDHEVCAHFVESSLRFHQELLSLTLDWTLDGYFQCERYFEAIQQLIRTEIFAELCKSMPTMEMAGQIRRAGEKSCFVHVRRSDNLRPAGLSFHGLLSAGDYPHSYYQRAMDLMRERIPNVQFFVFSDEPEWCRDWLQKAREFSVTVVGHNAPSFTVDAQHNLHRNDQGREVEDLWLMSLCRHAIIANSSFSWWGAWLGDAQPNRIVLAPEPWFASQEADSRDIIPSRWQKVLVSG